MTMKRILVTGADGVLGGSLLRELSRRGLSAVAWTGRQMLDLTDHAAVTAAFQSASPEAVIHAAALSRVADCYSDARLARRINTDATAHLARLCRDAGCRLVFVSTDLVFDGEDAPYREEDAPAPLSVYGRTKAEAESEVLAYRGHAVARVSLMYGPALSGQRSFFDSLVESLRQGRRTTLYSDEWRTPLALTTAAEALVELALSDRTGLFHIGGPQRMSRLEMGRRLAKVLKLSDDAVRAAGRPNDGFQERRPRDVSLDSSRWRSAFPGVAWPRYEESLAGMLGLS
jgi:dTDP-4-dehydrorhamnose reductase